MTPLYGRTRRGCGFYLVRVLRDELGKSEAKIAAVAR